MRSVNRPFVIEQRYTEIKSIAFNKYLNDLSSTFDTKPIPRELERELIEKAQKGCAHSRDRLVHANLRFVVSYAKIFYKNNPVIQMEDLVQEANIGLLKAISAYDLKYDFKLITYARFWMFAKVTTNIQKNMNVIRLSSNGIKENAIIKDAQDLFFQTNERFATDEELAQLTDIPIEKIRSFSKISYTKSLNQQVSNQNQQSNTEKLDVLPSGESSIEDTIDSLTAVVGRYLNKLDKRTSTLLKYRFGIGCHFKNRLSRAKILGLTPERARQLEIKGLETLKEMMGSSDEMKLFC